MEDLGIYIHIPFCKRKCKYCDFVSFENCENIEEYFKVLKKEIVYKSQIYNLENRIIKTIYFGGGTPSYPNEIYIEEILNLIKEKFNVSNEAEITLELNPGTANEKKLKRYKEIGINRLSIGLQSTHNRLLELVGRIHTYEEFLDIYHKAKVIGFENINVDLLLAIPTQTMEELVTSVNQVINLEPNHISLYSLILEEGTKLEELINSGKLSLVDENLERKMYWKTKEILENNGYKHYEISNFAKEGFESKHNMDCWKQKEYLGFGIASHSYFDDKRFSNIVLLNEYINNINNNNIEKNIVIEEIQNKASKMKEFMMIGLRKIKGISISEFERKFEINPLFYFRFEIEKLTNEELLEVDLDDIKLTKKGLDFANLVFEEFV